MSGEGKRGAGASEEPRRVSAAMQAPLADEDFYMDGPYVVFTAAYHLKRGYCCGSGCRHCPYRRESDD